MQSLAKLDLKRGYRTREGDPVKLFYNPCLAEASNYIRGAGYFRSTVFVLIGPALVQFAKRGGTMRLVCSPSMSDEDIRAAKDGLKVAVDKSVLHDLDLLLSTSATSYRTKVLATLLASGHLEIKLAVPSTGSGIYHEKKGIFEDGLGNAVSFIGSSNETLSAWSTAGNFESIEVFCSWKGTDPAERVAEHSEYLHRLWDDEVPGVNVGGLPESATARLRDAAFRSIEEIDDTLLEPREKRRSILPHQASALDEWRKQNRRGILEHATGSGKTFTAISAIREHLDQGGAALVLVPNLLLLDQWNTELLAELEGATVMCVGGEYSDWARPHTLESMTADGNGSGLGPRVTVATIQTASRPEFLRRVRGGQHLFVVGDEVHSLGSTQFSRALQISSGPRLGLSATPQRFGDPVGTAAILDYFGPVIQPPFTLVDAIAAGRLVPYEYYPHPVRLNDDEAKEWKRLTQKIGAEYGAAEGGQLSDQAKLLLIQRARIAKKAGEKVPLAVRILKKYYETGQRWLVYCEDSAQLGEVMRGLRTVDLSPIEYHTGMAGDKDANLAWFTTHGGILVSIHCLDEGVDIPAVSHALVLASSQNPRQFIQRRGRILRASPGKRFAVLHDAIVLPVADQEVNLAALADAEFARAVEFAKGALNKSALLELMDWAGRYGINLQAGNTDIEIEP
jgi:superfamily II DNA or RNA helicase